MSIISLRVSKATFETGVEVQCLAPPVILVLNNKWHRASGAKGRIEASSELLTESEADIRNASERNL